MAQLLLTSFLINVHSCQKPSTPPHPSSADRISCSSLPSRIADRTVSGDLAILYGRVDLNQLDIASAIPLVEQIVRNEPDGSTWNDADIWHAVFELVARANPVTPSTAFEKVVFDTPLRSSSAAQRGIEQTHDEVDQRILEELTRRVYLHVGGFYERYFEGKSWTNNARDIYEGSRALYAEGRWSEWPEPPIQGPFLEWFMKFQDTVFSGLRRYYTSANKVLRGSEADRKLDVFSPPPTLPYRKAITTRQMYLLLGNTKGILTRIV